MTEHPPPRTDLAEAQRAIALAGARLAAGDRAQAGDLCRQAIAYCPPRHPVSADAWLMLAVAALQEGDAAAALSACDAALAARADYPPALAQKARALSLAGRGAEAVAVALSAAPNARDAYTLDTLGVTLTHAGRHSDAVEVYSRAVKLSPQPGYWFNYAASLQFVGRFEEAREAYRRCLANAPLHADAWAGLLQITRQTRAENDIAAMTRAFDALKGDGDAELALGHALAKAYEDLGEPAEVMEWLGRAKARHAHLYDPAVDAARFDAALATLDLPLRASPGGGDSARAALRPIFVVGMPRTGTTLVERILSSHSAITTAGELLEFSLALSARAGLKPRSTVDPDVIGRITELARAGGDLEAIGYDYLARAQGAAGVSGCFVDKLPFNAFHAPLILQAMPTARIVCLRRHPADAVLSNYRQAFAKGSDLTAYAFDREAAARYTVRFAAMTRAFEARLPADRLLTVAYEDIVANLQGEVQRMLAFCGLPFEPACLDFHANASPVATASSAQVREPLYATSVSRWRRYRPAIDPALRILVAAGAMAADEVGA